MMLHSEIEILNWYKEYIHKDITPEQESLIWFLMDVVRAHHPPDMAEVITFVVASAEFQWNLSQECNLFVELVNYSGSFNLATASKYDQWVFDTNGDLKKAIDMRKEHNLLI